jgi:enoyl-CoA hydratase/carnithine racemase
MVVTDFALTHPESKVGYPEVDLGVCPAVVAPWLIRKIGAGRARAMLLAGGTMSGEDGFNAGLATHLVPETQLESAALELAGKLAKGGPHAMAVTKRWLNELDGSMDDAPLDKAAELSAKVIAGDEAQARLRKIYGL